MIKTIFYQAIITSPDYSSVCVVFAAVLLFFWLYMHIGHNEKNTLFYCCRAWSFYQYFLSVDFDLLTTCEWKRPSDENVFNCHQMETLLTFWHVKARKSSSLQSELLHNIFMLGDLTWYSGHLTFRHRKSVIYLRQHIYQTYQICQIQASVSEYTSVVGYKGQSIDNV